MAKKMSKIAKNGAAHGKHGRPISLPLFENGFSNMGELCRASIALGADLIAQRVPVGAGNAAGRQVANTLKGLDLQLRHGSKTTNGGPKVLQIT